MNYMLEKFLSGAARVFNKLNFNKQAILLLQRLNVHILFFNKEISYSLYS
jgi:hypothetical protein